MLVPPDFHIQVVIAVATVLLLVLVLRGVSTDVVLPALVDVPPSDVAVVKCYKCKIVRDSIPSDRFVVKCAKCI